MPLILKQLPNLLYNYVYIIHMQQKIIKIDNNKLQFFLSNSDTNHKIKHKNLITSNQIYHNNFVLRNLEIPSIRKIQHYSIDNNQKEKQDKIDRNIVEKKQFLQYSQLSKQLRFPKIFQNQKGLGINTSRSKVTSKQIQIKNYINESISLSDPILIYTPQKLQKNNIIKKFSNKSQFQDNSLGTLIKQKLINLRNIQGDIIGNKNNAIINYKSKSKQIKNRQKYSIMMGANLSTLFNNPNFKNNHPLIKDFSRIRQQKKKLLLQTLEVYSTPGKDLSKQNSKQLQGKDVLSQYQIIQSRINTLQQKLHSIGIQDHQNHKYQKQQKKQRKPHLSDLKFEFGDIEFKEFLDLMRSYNFLKIGQHKQGSYKAFIGNGNNSILIKKVLKSKGYWSFIETIEDDVNFVWSQKKNLKFCQKLQNRILAIKSQQRKQILKQKNPLFDQFLNKKKNKYPFIQGVENVYNKKIFHLYINNLIQTNLKFPKKTSHFYKLTQFFNFNRKKTSQILEISDPRLIKLHNHLQEASSIGNKKGLYYYMKKYYQFINQNPFEILPKTIHISSSQKIQNQKQLKQLIKFSLPCILKPGQNTNRGKGITVHTTWSSLYEAIKNNSKHQNGKQRTHIIQQYIFPFLYYNRKFDIRIWVLWNGRQAWWYKQGYIRTSSKDFNIKSTSRYVHLTNDAIQKYSDDYGKYEAANKISFNQFQKYLEHIGSKFDFWRDIYPKMKKIAIDVFRVANFTIDKHNKQFGYQLFGLDFMIDQKFNVWLIEVNTNPCLETSCSLLNRLITNMIQNMIYIAVDPLFPAPKNWKKKSNFNLQNFKFEIIYDGYEQDLNNLFEQNLQFETDEDEFEEKNEELLNDGHQQSIIN